MGDEKALEHNKNMIILEVHGRLAGGGCPVD
jgi:hypothetical protein